ncbi:MAG: hypothetical protein CMD92_02015 [Gammaproteobacteria bacterium]|nr:hypothetical protein [Gammaproteobacteria bacterium]HBW83767.1 hypothetical protein [Gammaproteobacteria bacterium]
MKFLVILICLVVNHLRSDDCDRLDDSWFFRLRRLTDQALSRFERKRKLPWLVPVISIYAFLLLALFITLHFVSDVLYGFATMLIHIWVLLVALDRTQPRKLASAFLVRWRDGDFRASLHFLQEEGLIAEGLAFKSDAQVFIHFKEQFIYRCFEKIFVMLFSYLLAGAFGVLFAYVSYQLRYSYKESQHAKREKLIDGIILALEWIPVRLLALTFSLVGNFVLCFDKLRPQLLDFSQRSSSADLYVYATCALSQVAGSGLNIGEPRPIKLDLISKGSDRVIQEGEIEALQALLERSQTIWLAGLALVTLVGLQAF